MDIPPEADSAFRINVSKMSVGVPEEIRPQLRALVAGVVSLAQDVYRRRLTVVADEAVRARSPAAERSITVGDQWPTIVDVLTRRLEDQPELLDSVLVELANIRPAAAAPEGISSSRNG